jgi:uncharacterized membrane protein YhaH (DUF805 family)
MPTLFKPRSAFDRSVEPITPAQVFFSYRGRIPRRMFWTYGVAAMIGIGTLGWMLLTIAGMPQPRADRLMWLLLAWPSTAICAKRWHDAGRSGWWALWVLVPVVGTLVTLLANGFLHGTRGPNAFGTSLGEEE